MMEKGVIPLLNVSDILPFRMEDGWFEQTENGELIYTNIAANGIRIVGGAGRFARREAIPLRQSVRFPMKRDKNMSDLVFYHGRKKDYLYFPTEFTDTAGEVRPSGYYSDGGKYYEEIKFVIPSAEEATQNMENGTDCLVALEEPAEAAEEEQKQSEEEVLPKEVRKKKRVLPKQTFESFNWPDEEKPPENESKKSDDIFEDVMRNSVRKACSFLLILAVIGLVQTCSGGILILACLFQLIARVFEFFG